MSSVNYAVLFTEGQVSLKAIQRECAKQQWIPVCTYTTIGNETPVVILFHQQEDVKKFSKRNLPSNWLIGAVELTQAELDWIKGKGWNIEVLDYPRKYKDRSDVKLGFEVIELQETPDLFYHKK